VLRSSKQRAGQEIQDDLLIFEVGTEADVMLIIRIRMLLAFIYRTFCDKCFCVVPTYLKPFTVFTEKVNFLFFFVLNRGHAVAHLVEALCYKPGGRRFDSPWCYFSLT
jgi:hypothetical protein